MEKQIKEQQIYLLANRTRSTSFRANRTRLYLPSIACMLLDVLRGIGLEGTDLAQACPYAHLSWRAVADLRAPPAS